MMARPEGIILVTGPTGSGKTTTLYSVLNHINDESRQHHDPGGSGRISDGADAPDLGRTKSAKLDFANGIRSMMRQDPDIILVGEIRDDETAEMAFRAAMTGHQVYLDAAHQLGDRRHSAPARYRHPARHHGRQHRSASSPSAWCAGCAVTAGVLDGTVRRRSAACWRWATTTSDGALYRRRGCEHCGPQGYRGRLAIMEMLRMDGDLDELIARRATAARDRAACAWTRASARWPKTACGACWTAAPPSRRCRAWSISPTAWPEAATTMPAFEYKAIDSLTASRSSGRIEATNDVDLELRLKRMGLDLIVTARRHNPGARCSAGRRFSGAN